MKAVALEMIFIQLHMMAAGRLFGMIQRVNHYLKLIIEVGRQMIDLDV